MKTDETRELAYPVHPLAEFYSFATTLSQYEKILSRIEKWGFQLNPTSRVTRYRDMLRAALENDPPYAPVKDLERLSFVFLEISEIIEIIEAIKTPSLRMRQRIALLLKGEMHPDDEGYSAGRDAQYELWIRAFFRKKGLASILGDPDIRFRWKGNTIPLEAKRPGSLKSLDDRYRKALQQLDHYPQGGVVAISLDLLLRPHGEVLYAESPLEASESMDLLFLDQVKKLISKDSPLTRRGGDRNVIGFFITAKLPAFIRGHGAFAAEFRYELLWPESDTRRKALVGLRCLVSSYVSREGGIAP